MLRVTWALRGLAAALVASVAIGSASVSAQPTPRRHAVSLVGEPKFGPDFKNFTWVNPDAPKGGRVRESIVGSFDSLNPFPAQGDPAVYIDLLVFDRLFASSSDEAATSYGLIGEWLSYPPDYSSVTIGLREGPRFHDGRPVTVEDVIFSMDALKKASPLYSSYYKDVLGGEKTGPREVTFRFSAKNNRELPQIVSELPIIPKHWWEGKGADGQPRDITKSTLEAPLGSGPYKFKSVEPGRQTTYERVKDWWAKDLPVSKGQWNFDEITFVYFRERTAAFENFKSGNLDYWPENSAKSWATEFEFDAVKKGLVERRTVPVMRVAPTQAFAMNMRRKAFADVRVRHALALAFDFEWANKNLFYDLYTRVGSYFDNSELAATALPTGRELELLNEVKADIPPEVFTSEWKNPVNAKPEDQRRNLGLATKLLAEAGYTAKNGVMSNAAGEPLAFEMLLDNPVFERIAQPYKSWLEKLGIRMSIRQIDSAQYQRRLQKFDYDMIVHTFSQSESPGNEQRNFWGTTAADLEGSDNLIGIKSRAVDHLVDKVIFAKDRADLVAATRALDRVLRWNFYIVPGWYRSDEWLAMWNQYGAPATLPRQASAFLQTWWLDDAKAKALAERRGK